MEGDLRAIDLLPRLCRVVDLATHPSSRRRGVCDGLADASRACSPLGGFVFAVHRMGAGQAWNRGFGLVVLWLWRTSMEPMRYSLS